MKSKDPIFSTFFYGIHDRALRPESRMIYRRNLKIKMALSLLLIIGMFIVVLIKDTGYVSRYLAWIILTYIVFIVAVELFRGETFYQLRLRDRKVDKSDAREVLKSMKEMDNGKK